LTSRLEEKKVSTAAITGTPENAAGTPARTAQTPSSADEPELVRSENRTSQR